MKIHPVLVGPDSIALYSRGTE